MKQENNKKMKQENNKKYPYYRYYTVKKYNMDWFIRVKETEFSEVRKHLSGTTIEEYKDYFLKEDDIYNKCLDEINKNGFTVVLEMVGISNEEEESIIKEIENREEFHEWWQ